MWLADNRVSKAKGCCRRITYIAIELQRSFWRKNKRDVGSKLGCFGKGRAAFLIFWECHSFDQNPGLIIRFIFYVFRGNPF